MAGAALRSVPQLGMDEQTITDEVIEEALDEREKRRASARAVRKQYTEAHVKAVALIERLELPEGGVARVGRFRISRLSIEARTVSFETEPTSRLSISVADKG